MEEEKATDKQCKFMHRLGIEYNMETTKTAARLMIDAKLQEKNGNGDAKPILDSSNKIPIPSPEVVKIPNALALVGDKLVEVKPKDNGFHLTPEQCRSNALSSAIECWRDRKDPSTLAIDMLLEQAKVFEKYIVTGE